MHDLEQTVEGMVRERDAEIARREAAERELRAALSSFEDRLERTRTQLILAERRSAFATLAGGVGNELRNLGQVHIGAVEILEHALAESVDAEIVAALDDLRRVGMHVASHARRLLSLARPGPDHLRILDTNRVVEDTIAMLTAAGKLRGLEIVFVPESAPVFVSVNRTRIEQILVNLLVNASEAIGRGSGQVLVATREDKLRKRIVIEVTDTGPGIKPDVLPRICDPFFTTKGEGTGLGLSVVKEIVESYGGELAISTSLGVGSTFTFDLPLALQRASS
jgi:signal transduction histidine kinase